MDKVKLCFDRIQVIRGVNYGQISNEQIRNVFVAYDLDEEQQVQFFELIHNMGIHPISENEMCRPMQKVCLQQPEKQFVPTMQNFEERYKNALDACLESLGNDEKLIIQYQDELQLLKHSISTASSNSNAKPYQIITRAVMEISSFRVQEIRKKGWVCGTYMSHVRNTFIRWLCFLFTEADMSELICCCTENETLSKKHQEMLMVILHNTPHTLVHPRYSYYFDE